VPWKRPLDLLEATAKTPDMYAFFAGDGEQRALLSARADELGVADRLRLIGFVNQQALPETYAAADVLVLPSEYEPFGVVVNEAFACGTPALVSRACGSAGDLVVDNETGFTFPPGDVDALADALARLRDDPDLRRHLAEGARQRIEERGPEQNVEAFVSACHRIAGRRR
jgi:glycosyltransferase involved in cell wall biosynthesis